MNLNWCFLRVIVYFSTVNSLPVLRHSVSRTSNNLFSLEFTCKAKVDSGDFLLVYLKKTGLSDICLYKHQYTREGQGQYNTAINTAVDESYDNGTLICIQQDEIGKAKGNATNVIHLPPDPEPYVDVFPRAQRVQFHPNQTLVFVCRGSAPVDGRSLTWFIQKFGSKLNYAETQYTNSTSEVTLLLHLDASYHRSRIFCAQNRHRHEIKKGPERFSVTIINKIAWSHNITLNLQKEEQARTAPAPTIDSSETSPSSNGISSLDGKTTSPYSPDEPESAILPTPIILAIGLGAAAALLLAAAAALVLVRRRRQRYAVPTEIDTRDDVYATAQVTYAILDLQSSTTDYVSVPGREKTPYAQIIGVYNKDKTRQ